MNAVPERLSLRWRDRLVGEDNAYGKVTHLALGGGEQLEQPLRFQGQYFDAESGLHYNRHRYYDPDLGRYLTPDPVKLAGGLNQYQYTPNPTGWVDPLGLACAACPGDVEGPYSEIVPGGGLDAHERRGGHLIEKHVGRTKAQLAERLDDEPWLVRASTFYDRATAEKAISNVLAANKKQIEAFKKSKNGQLVIKDSVSHPAGVYLKRHASTVTPTSKVLLVLRPDKKLPTGYRIHTGYVEK